MHPKLRLFLNLYFMLSFVIVAPYIEKSAIGKIDGLASLIFYGVLAALWGLGVSKVFGALERNYQNRRVVRR